MVKVKDVSKPLSRGKAGGLATRRKYGNAFYSKIAKDMQQKRINSYVDNLGKTS